ncbi:hypothetical protein [Sulfurimonas sp.]|jgi:Tfp pilus assembly protein PilX|uniref:hypothetical protein n=1 Tax=Sulfurimonas sp. TaxID=2022749 RepID=UPI0025FF5E8F|nr:hypothetical protein [Sulfurimonas sp.]MBT5934703.1 hypothetical protein [Sulfurimonas sp.]
MQRKNNILNRSRSGMAMIMAIAVIVIIGTIMALSLAMTAQTTKRTADLYLYEQAMLLSKSATEYALLRIARDNNATNPCNFTGDNFTQNGIYDINISVRYIYNTVGTCAGALQYATVVTPEQNGSVLMDVTVSVPQAANVATEPITYFKRTIQKL